MPKNIRKVLDNGGCELNVVQAGGHYTQALGDCQILPRKKRAFQFWAIHALLPWQSELRLFRPPAPERIMPAPERQHISSFTNASRMLF